MFKLQAISTAVLIMFVETLQRLMIIHGAVLRILQHHRGPTKRGYSRATVSHSCKLISISGFKIISANTLFSFSEYGCTKVLPRTFTEIPVLYSDNMTPVYSGGLIYQYSLEGDTVLQESALVRISPDGSTATPLADFNTVKTQFGNTPVPGDGGYKTNGVASNCPPMNAIWQSNTSLPIIPASAQTFMTNGAGKPLGNKNGNSQWAGTPSPGWAPMDQNSTGSGKKTSAAVNTPASSLSSSLYIALALVAVFFAFN
jgi:1,3-beta-glucanosyltransferase GAS5